MRLRVLIASAVLAVTAVCATSARAQVAAGDSVTGSGLFTTCAPWPDCGGPFLGNFEIDARSGASGENATGTFTAHLGGGFGFNWTATVSCLAVSGDTAVIGFSGKVAGGVIPVSFWTAGFVRVVDVGGPGEGDTIEWSCALGEQGSGDPPPGDPLPGPTDCSSYPASFPLPEGPHVVGSGDIIVTDAQLFPTSKEQCKKGGWASFGFRNQGQCVAFVERGPKPPRR
jgi:hypothetical protein